MYSFAKTGKYPIDIFVCRKVTGENISFDLYSAESSAPRYTLHVVDSKKRLGNKFAIFIVPEGRLV